MKGSTGTTALPAWRVLVGLRGDGGECRSTASFRTRAAGIAYVSVQPELPELPLTPSISSMRNATASDWNRALDIRLAWLTEAVTTWSRSRLHRFMKNAHKQSPF